MFSQSKQSQPAFKFVIRSDLSKDDPSIGDDTTTSTSTPSDNSPLPVSTEHNASSTDQLTSPAHDLATASSNIDRKRKRTAKENGSAATKKVHSFLERWGQSQEELAVSQEGTGEEEELLARQQTVSQSTELSDSLDTDFGDYQLMACLLCNRKFKSKQDITRHQALSDLHKKNSQDPIAVDNARTKLRQRTAKQTAPSPTSLDISTNSSDTPIVYRNRAAERRQAYNQPECPNLEVPYNRRHPPSKSSQQANITKSFESGATLTKPMADDNVGARMLKQMGWQKGQGLGKEGEGIVDPVTAERYAQGAGLGLANAKSRIDIGGSQSYKDRAKDLARRRLQEEL